MNRVNFTQNNIQDIFNFIHTNIDDKLTLEELAKISSYSPFHFHRKFKQFIGETPNDYILRTRLEKMIWLILIGIIIYMGVGMLYYSPFLLGNKWVEVLNIKDPKRNYGLLSLVTVLTTTVLYALLQIKLQHLTPLQVEP